MGLLSNPIFFAHIKIASYKFRRSLRSKSDFEIPVILKKIWKSKFGSKSVSSISESGAASNQNIKDIFSGISREVTIEKGTTNVITVTCTRLAAKIDVQWDAQGAYENGKFIEASMSEITLNGLAQGYVFPSKVSNITYSSIIDGVATFTANDPISERNGRTYFYTFPMVGQDLTGEVKKNAIQFTVTYNDGSGAVNQKYTATFDEPSNPNTWYKVNIQVNGTTASATEGNHELVLTQTQAGN